jgi:hypothetical protein
MYEHRAAVLAGDLSGGGTQLVTGSEDGKLNLWQVQWPTLRKKATAHVDHGAVTAVTSTGRADSFITATSLGEVSLWQPTESGRPDTLAKQTLTSVVPSERRRGARRL